MRTSGGVWIQLDVYLASALDEGEWSASHRGLFTPGKGVPGTSYVGGRLDCRADVGCMKKRKISCFCWESSLPSL
jgi:hypothetical protein